MIFFFSAGRGGHPLRRAHFFLSALSVPGAVRGDRILPGLRQNTLPGSIFFQNMAESEDTAVRQNFNRKGTVRQSFRFF